MKISIVMLGLCFACYGSVWAQSDLSAPDLSTLKSANLITQPNSGPEDQITTRDHEVYRGVTIIRTDPAGLTFSYNNSTPALMMKRLNFQDLPEALQEKYHYDPQRAAAYEISQQKVELELKQRLEVDDQISTDLNNRRAEAEEAWEQSMILEQQRSKDGSMIMGQNEPQVENGYPWNYFVSGGYTYYHRPCAWRRNSSLASKSNFAHRYYPVSAGVHEAYRPVSNLAMGRH
jgi:hypothetical protein